MFCSVGTLHKACQCVSLIVGQGKSRVARFESSLIVDLTAFHLWSTYLSHIKNPFPVGPWIAWQVKQGAGTAGYLRCSHSCWFMKFIHWRWKCQAKKNMSLFGFLSGQMAAFSYVSLPQINIDSCRLSCEWLWVTGGQSAFTALSLPVSVFPTNAAGSLLVSVMQKWAWWAHDVSTSAAVIQTVPF